MASGRSNGPDRDPLSGILSSDRGRVLHLLRRIDRAGKSGRPTDRLEAEFRKLHGESARRYADRSATVPAPKYDPSLPITARREEIVEAIRSNQVVIVAGETGSGKTTQIPKMCLEAGRGAAGMVGCTQPRRIAASAMAERVAEELETEVGREVGFQVRFREALGETTLIKFMTDGILLAESVRDRFLGAYDTLIIDEAHERSLNVDFLLGFLKQLLPRRRDLKVIVTSATIDTQKFSRHFDDAPVIEVSGRGYPVDILYRPLADPNANAGAGSSRAEKGGANDRLADRDLYRGIADGVRALEKIDPRGDILVFLASEREIHEAARFLERRGLRHTEVLPLYARLSHAGQQRIFHPGAERRIILSTNVAETSLTVPRIRFVIDSGLARISRYSHRSRIQRLPIEAISRASANQRAGRCGRLGPGTCIRLYDEDDFQSRPEFTDPEVLRTSLASVILRMLVTGLGSVEAFPFVDPPAPRMIKDGYQLLAELGAIDDQREPTAIGRQMLDWPVDVRLARMILASRQADCTDDLLALVAALSIQDPRERPADRQAAADQAHERFLDDRSDFDSLLALWRHLRGLRKRSSGSGFRKACDAQFLSWRRAFEWFDVYRQLRLLARENDYPLPRSRLADDARYEAIHKCLLAGLLSHVGQKHPEGGGYQGIRGRGFDVFPGSGQFGKSPQWIIAGEIVETSRTWGRIVARIQPEWIEEVGGHQIKRRVFDAHWSRKRGAVMAWEQLSLHGLVVVEKRRVRYAPIDPGEARRIFILEGLVRGGLDTRSEFMVHNEGLRLQVEAMEDKRRRRDVLADEQAQVDFFDARIPPEVVSTRTFERWLASIGEKGARSLFMGIEVLLRDDAGEAPGEQFPDWLSIGGHRLALSYAFEPGDPRDGVTLKVPLEWLNTIDAGELQWLVPGMLRDKVVDLIRGLPKPMRRVLTPIPEFADAALQRMGTDRSRPLDSALAETLSAIAGLEVDASLLDESLLDAHHRFLVVVEDASGRELANGRDLEALQASLGAQAQRRFMDRQGAGYHRDGLTEWNFGDLEAKVTTREGVVAWPALVDQGESVGIRLFDSATEAAWSHHAGVLRLLSLALADKMRYLHKHPGLSRQGLMAWQPVGSAKGLIADLVSAAVAEATGSLAGVRSRAQFDAVRDRARSRVGHECRRIAEQLETVLNARNRLAELLSGIEQSRPEAWQDVSEQLDDLVYEGFVGDVGLVRLIHYPRYLDGIEMRLQGLERDPARDAERMARVAPWWRRYTDWIGGGGEYSASVDTYRWLIEEFRISQFAQQLGTATKVSEKILAAAWREVEAE